MILQDLKSVKIKADKKEFRKFGITVGIFLIALGAVFLWQGKFFASYLIYIGLLLLSLALLIPQILKPLHFIWMSFAMILGYFMTRIILSLIFFLLFTSIGIVMRLFKKDPLQERFNPNANSYWIKRKRRTHDPQSVEKQY